MYLTFSEGALPNILCPEAIQWVLEVLKVSMNLTNWVQVGSQSPNLAVQLRIRLKSEISVVFGFLKATVDELPKENIELPTGTLREADSRAPRAPIYCEFVLPQLDKGVPVDRTGMACVPDDPDEQNCTDSMADVDAKPKANPKPKASKPKPKKGAASNPLGVAAGGSTEPQATPTKSARSPCDGARRRMVMRNRHNRRINSWSRHTKEIRIHCLSRKDSHRHQTDWRTLRIW